MPKLDITLKDALAVLGVSKADSEANAGKLKEALSRKPSMKLDKEPDKGVISVHITDFPDKDGKKIGLRMRFTPSSTSIKLQGHNTESFDDKNAQLWANIESGATNWHLDWIGTRPGTPPCPYGGDELMTFAVGMAKASGAATFDLKDVSGVPLGKIATCDVALRITGVYNEGQTWYMKYGAFPGDLSNYRKAAEYLKGLKVEQVLKDLGGLKKTKKDGEEESKLTLLETTDHLIEKLKGAKLTTSMRVGELYMKAVPELKGNAEAARLLYNFYGIAMRRFVDKDPNVDASKAAKLIWNSATFTCQTDKISCITAAKNKIGVAIKVKS